MTWKGPRALPLVAAVLGLIGAAGCGSDESGEDTTAAQVSVPAITSPLGTTSTTPTSTAPGKRKPTETTGGAGGTGGAAPCAIPDSFQSFRYAGLDCAAAVAVAQAWDSNGKACNTIDNPNVDEGYRRTCSVEGYSCMAKRDVHSDARFVTCTQGGQRVRFTWLPA